MKSLRMLFLLIIILASNSFARNSNFGLGLMIGEPTGISAKYWLNNVNAIDGGLAYSFVGVKNRLSLHVDYLYHSEGIVEANYRIPLYYGFGARIRNNSEEKGSLGVRGVVGMYTNLTNFPVDVFFEIAPVFQLLPETQLGLDVSLGARYYF